MADNPKPVGIPPRAAGAYEVQLRRSIVDPAMRQLRRTLERLAAQGVVTPEDVQRRILETMRLAYRAAEDVAEGAAFSHIAGVAKWHRRKLLAEFRKVGLDIAPFLSEDAVRQALDRRIADNVRLIKTIPERMHGSLVRRVRKQAADGWRFDPGFLERTLRAEYKSTGYNLRRLTRDQTTKQIGQLTQIRHQQAGFERYVWLTAGDERVRDTHAANDESLFRWTEPPQTGHPGQEIQCRCQAQAWVEDADIERVAAALRAA